MKTITCREHGGTFSIEPRRGRPPVKCSEGNRCTPVEQIASKIPVRKSAPRERRLPIEREVTTKATRDAEAIAAAKARVTANATKAAKQISAGVDKALAAKARLEPLGWKTTGTKDGTDVVLSGVRGEERIAIRWNASGDLVWQQYDLWHSDVPKKNGKPASNLPFDPDEVPDKEIARMLSGTKVTWWNVLAGAEQSAVISGTKVSIGHAYDSHGDEQPSDRVITFVDATGAGFRSFRLGALLKVG